MAALIRGAEGAYKLATTCKIIAYIAHVWHFGAVFRRFYMGNVDLKLPISLPISPTQNAARILGWHKVIHNLLNNLFHIGINAQPIWYQLLTHNLSQYGFITKPSWPRQMTAPKWWRS